VSIHRPLASLAGLVEHKKYVINITYLFSCLLLNSPQQGRQYLAGLLLVGPRAEGSSAEGALTRVAPLGWGSRAAMAVKYGRDSFFGRLPGMVLLRPFFAVLFRGLFFRSIRSKRRIPRSRTPSCRRARAVTAGSEADASQAELV
jgi:hypothetical protein